MVKATRPEGLNNSTTEAIIKVKIEGRNMNCNYFTDNTKDIETLKNDSNYTAFFDPNKDPQYSCKTGACEYEPTTEEMQDYCTNDFLHCPRLRIKLYKM